MTALTTSILEAGAQSPSRLEGPHWGQAAPSGWPEIWLNAGHPLQHSWGIRPPDISVGSPAWQWQLVGGSE